MTIKVPRAQTGRDRPQAAAPEPGGAHRELECVRSVSVYRTDVGLAPDAAVLGVDRRRCAVWEVLARPALHLGAHRRHGMGWCCRFDADGTAAVNLVAPLRDRSRSRSAMSRAILGLVHEPEDGSCPSSYWIAPAEAGHRRPCQDSTPADRRVTRASGIRPTRLRVGAPAALARRARSAAGGAAVVRPDPRAPMVERGDTRRAPHDGCRGRYPPPLRAAPAAARPCRGAGARGRAADRHPAPAGPQQPRHHQRVLRGIDNAETVHARRAPIIPVGGSMRV